MSGDAPYAGHNPVVVLLLILAGVLATLWLALYGLGLLVRAQTAGTTRSALKAAAALAGAAAVGTYTWGVLHLFFLDDTDQSRVCNAAVGSKRLTGYEPSFIPLRFGCRTSDGHTAQAAVVPSYVNPATAVFGLCAVTLTGFAVTRISSERTLRA